MKKASDYLKLTKVDLLILLYDTIQPLFDSEDLEKTRTKATNLWQLNKVTMASLCAAIENKRGLTKSE